MCKSEAAPGDTFPISKQLPLSYQLDSLDLKNNKSDVDKSPAQIRRLPKALVRAHRRPHPKRLSAPLRRMAWGLGGYLLSNQLTPRPPLHEGEKQPG